MHTFGFSKNTVFNWQAKTYRVDRINLDGKVLIESLADGLMSLVEKSHLLKEYTDGKIEANTDSEMTKKIVNKFFSRPLEELPEKIKTETSRRKHYINAIYRDGYPKFTRKYLHTVITQAAIEIGDESPPSIITVYRWNRSYTSSKDTRSLIPKLYARGSRKIKVNERVLKLLIETMEQSIKASPQCTIANIVNLLEGRIIEENKMLMPEEQMKIPGRRTIYRLLSKVEVFNLVSLKEGKVAAEKLFRLVKNKVITNNILERVEIDHTPLDLFLIDERTYLPLGRPTVTIIIDHFSRMILGYFISYQNPSTAAVMGALRHAILPKTQVHKAIPNLVIEHDWACYGVPEQMILDNGLEFHSDALESVAFDLGIQMQFCPKHEPRFKGVVERFLKTLNYSFASQIPGASFARWHLRGEYDPQKHAILTLGEFTQLFEKWVLDIYAQTKHRGIATTPWAKWHEGLKTRELTLPLSLRELQKRIGKIDARSLRRDGIKLKGITYQSEELASILRAYGEGVRVRVLYDPQDLGEIQVWAPNAEDAITVEALDLSYAKGLTELQNGYIQTKMREDGNRVVNKDALIKARHDLSNEIQSLIESRHLKDRKRGGKLSGISSANPQGSLLENKQTLLKNTKIKVQTIQPIYKPTNQNQPYQLPDLLPTFNINSKRQKND
jgi:putative transposase